MSNETKPSKQYESLAKLSDIQENFKVCEVMEMLHGLHEDFNLVIEVLNNNTERFDKLRDSYNRNTEVMNKLLDRIKTDASDSDWWKSEKDTD